MAALKELWPAGQECWGCVAWRNEGSKETLKHLKGTYKRGGEGLFTKACSDRTRRNAFKMNEDRFRLHKEEILHCGAGETWHKLCREAVDAPSLAMFKARLDGPFSNLA